LFENGSEYVYLEDVVEVISWVAAPPIVSRGEIIVIIGFLRGLVVKAMVLGVTFAAVKYGPVMYTKYVDPLPPALAEAHKYTDFNEVYKTFGEIAKKMPH
jgi:hypothetical protein